MDICDRSNYLSVRQSELITGLFIHSFLSVGAKVLALRDGIVDIHGTSTNSTWTKLASTAMVDSSNITLVQPVNWSVGAQIIIATTGDRLSQRQSELRRIVDISPDRRTLVLDSPLKYTHLGVTQEANSTMVEVRAEVGLLSHNVVFKGKYRLHDYLSLISVHDLGSITETWDDVIPECTAGYDPGRTQTKPCIFLYFHCNNYR